MRLIISLAFAAIMLSPALAQAQCGGTDALLELPEGQAIMSITATERSTVEQDLLIANLSYVVEKNDAKEVQNEINEAMTKALSTAKKVEEVKASTGSYQVYETTVPRTKEKKWRGSQTITLKSKDADALLELAGKLQDMKLTMNGLNYTLDPDTAAEMQDNMMEAALVKLQTRANRAAKALGKSSAELRDVSTQGSAPPIPMPHMARGAMMMADAEMAMATPVASAGETTLILTVSARAILKP